MRFRRLVFFSRWFSPAGPIGLALVALAALLLSFPMTAQVRSNQLQVCNRSGQDSGSHPREFTVGFDEFGGIGSDVDKAIEKALAHAANYYSEQGFDGKPVLQCFESSDSGETKFAVHYAVEGAPERLARGEEPLGSSLGDYDSVRCGLGTAKIRLNLQRVATQYGLMITGTKALAPEISTPAHELFHAVQSSYPLFSLCPDDWVWEGLAEAMAYLWLQDWKDRRTIDRTRSVRFWDYPLHKPKGHDDHPENSDNTQAYGTSLFWEYLTHDPQYVISGEAITAGLTGRADSALILRFMSMDRLKNKEYFALHSPTDWELRWLDEVLRDWFNPHLQRAKLAGGLYVVYPRFIAWMVDAVDDKSNLRHLFEGGCEKVTLNPDPMRPVPGGIPRLAPVASECVAVFFPPGTTANRSFSVNLMGSPARTKSIHVSWKGTPEQLVPRVDEKRKSWVVMPGPTEEPIYLTVANVSPVATDTEAFENLRLELRFEEKGEGQ